MSIKKTDDIHYKNIAKAIRNKNGETTKYYPSQMADAIDAIDITPPPVDDSMSDSSENAVQNKVIKAYIDESITNVTDEITYQIDYLKENGFDDDLDENSNNAVRNSVITGEISRIDSALDSQAEDIQGKQEELVSGENIKTINDQSVLGEGNINIEVPQITVDNALDSSSPNPIANSAVTARFNSDNIRILANTSAINGKQDTLESGTNIKTINNQSILGEGNLTVVDTVDSAMSDSSENPVQNKVVKAYIDTADASIENDINTIQAKIPSQATNVNQLADKEFVNSSISTATATFRGTFTDLTTLQATDGDNNDYAFYSHMDAAGNTVYDRYKYVGLPESRVPEGYTQMYSIGRTAAEGAYLNTGIILKNNYTIETKMIFGAVNAYTNRFYWGVIDNDGNSFRLQKPATSVLKITYNGGESQTVGINNDIEYFIEVRNNKFYINGVLSGNAIIPDINEGYPLYLFGYNNAGSGTSNGNITVKFCSFKVWDENGDIILDLVPCVNYENQAGMYDVVNGVFYGGSYSTTPISTDRWEYEYSLNNSSFTAEQWLAINSGLAQHVTSVGFDANAVQVLKNINGTLTWVTET